MMSGRRTTLGPLTASQTNSRASLAPSLAMKSSLAPSSTQNPPMPIGNVLGNSRMSMAPSTLSTGLSASQQSGAAAAGSGPTAAQRMSLAPGRMSMAPTARRQSMAPVAMMANGGRPSMAPAGLNPGAPSSAALNLPKRADPRPLSDKAFVMQCIRTLLTYLTEHGYEHPIVQKTLLQPSTREFLQILNFLFQKIDPTISVGAKPEDEIPVVFRRLGYPFPITKRIIQYQGNQNSWNTMLAAMTWLAQILTYEERLTEKQRQEIVELQSTASGSDGTEMSNRIFFEYLGRAYECFLAGDDSYSNWDNELARTFQQRNDQITDNIRNMESQCELLQSQINAMKEMPNPLVELSSKHRDLTSDIEKYKQVIGNLETSKKTIVQKIEQRQSESVLIMQEAEHLQKERKDLQSRVDSQVFSQDDMQRMSSDRKQLSEHFQSVSTRKDEILKQNWQFGLDIARFQQDVESMLADYNLKAQSLKMIPANAKYASGDRFDLRLVNDSDVFCGPVSLLDPSHSDRIRSRMREKLFQLKELYLTKCTKIQETVLKAKEELDLREEQKMEFKDDVERKQQRLQKCEGQYHDLRNHLNEEVQKIQAEIDVVEAEIHRLKSHQRFDLESLNRTVEDLKLQVERSRVRASEEADAASRMIITFLDSLTVHKTYVQDEIIKCENSFRRTVHELRTPSQ